MIKVSVVGATGYAGEELLKILVKHPQVSITSVSAKIDAPQKIDEIFPHLKGKLDLVCVEPSFDKIIAECDLVFLGLPHKVSMKIAPLFLKAGKKVIDLSADYRLKSVSLYEKCYLAKHVSSEYLEAAVYGLPEINKANIKGATLLANPGCFPTGIMLGSLPLLKKGCVQDNVFFADAKTGLSGAGREKEAQLIPLIKNNFKAYKVDQHQHAPEIEQELSSACNAKVSMVLTPHLIPIKRGILSTLYLKLTDALTSEDVISLYNDFYKCAPFVKVLDEGSFPELKDVQETNYCHIGISVNSEKKIAVVISAIDNLVKGASGQAVQNMNIMYGFNEKEALG